MNDSNFYKLHKKIGRNSLQWRWKFIGMLPEAYERRIHEKKGYESIFVYAAKLCGLSERQVRETLNLEKKFKETPTLHQLLVTGKVSHNKLARVASIATPKNEEELAKQIQVLSKPAVETFVRDFKSENGLNKPQNRPKFTPGRKLQEKLEELQNKGLNIDEILLELLEQREKNIQKKKNVIAKGSKQTDSHYIPVANKKILHEEYGTVCAAPNCYRKSVEYHHTLRFSMSKSHNPHFLAPLCKEHHEIAHSIDLKVQVRRREALL